MVSGNRVRFRTCIPNWSRPVSPSDAMHGDNRYWSARREHWSGSRRAPRFIRGTLGVWCSSGRRWENVSPAASCCMMETAFSVPARDCSPCRSRCSGTPEPDPGLPALRSHRPSIRAARADMGTPPTTACAISSRRRQRGRSAGSRTKPRSGAIPSRGRKRTVSVRPRSSCRSLIAITRPPAGVRQKGYRERKAGKGGSILDAGSILNAY